MNSVYRLTKKNSTAHKAVLASVKVKNSQVVAVADSHVLVPGVKPVDFGHLVSHAKNRTAHRRMPNMKTLQVEVNGTKKTIRITSRDLRSYQKLTRATAE